MLLDSGDVEERTKTLFIYAGSLNNDVGGVCYEPGREGLEQGRNSSGTCPLAQICMGE